MCAIVVSDTVTVCIVAIAKFDGKNSYAKNSHNSIAQTSKV